MVELLWDMSVTEAVLGFLPETRVGCIVTVRSPPEEEEGEEYESKKGGPDPP